MFTFLCVPSGFMAGLFVNRVYGEAYWYLTAVEAAGFAGMLTGSIFMSIHGSLAEQKKMLFCGLLMFGITGVTMGMTRNFLLYLVLMIGFGVAMTVVQTQVTATVQRLSREDMQGRTVGLLSFHVLWRHASWNGGLWVCGRLVPYTGDYGWGGDCCYMLRSDSDTGMIE